MPLIGAPISVTDTRFHAQEFSLIDCRHTWGEHRLYFHDEHGRICYLPASWTSLVTPEPFVELSAGRSLFRIEDLLALAVLLH